MKIYKSKVDIFNTITRYLGFSKIIITGSTALKMWELTTESNELDLDLIIYDIMPESWQKLLSLHELFGVEKQVVYPNSDKTTREVGTLVSLSFPTAKGDCLVHIFCMEKAKMTKMKREPFEMFVSGYKFYVNHPMNIIEAKKFHSREKDFKQLWNMAANLIAPSPEPIQAALNKIDTLERRVSRLEKIKGVTKIRPLFILHIRNTFSMQEQLNALSVLESKMPDYNFIMVPDLISEGILRIDQVLIDETVKPKDLKDIQELLLKSFKE